MNFHGDKTGTQENHHKHSPLKHMLHMILCCGIPMLIVGFLPLISRINSSTSRILGIIAPFICPIMMISMMGMMFRGNKKSSCCDNQNNETDSRDF